MVFCEGIPLWSLEEEEEDDDDDNDNDDDDKPPQMATYDYEHSSLRPGNDDTFCSSHGILNCKSYFHPIANSVFNINCLQPKIFLHRCNSCLVHTLN